MSHRLHELSREQAEIWVVGVVFVLVVKAIERALWEAWTAALIFGALGALVALWRLARGPRLGGTVIEITDEEVIFTLRFYIPTKTLRFPLDRIRVLRVVGFSLPAWFLEERGLTSGTELWALGAAGRRRRLPSRRTGPRRRRARSDPHYFPRPRREPRHRERTGPHRGGLRE